MAAIRPRDDYLINIKIIDPPSQGVAMRQRFHQTPTKGF
jgi:hypothetical protein